MNDTVRHFEGFSPRVVEALGAGSDRLRELVGWLESNAKAVDRHEHGTEYRVDLTKRLAQLIVDRTPHTSEMRQRKLNPRAVRKIAADIDAGLAVFNGQSVLVGPNGWAIDGQHRAHGVLIAETPGAHLPNVRVIVCKSVDAAKAIDIGTVRTVTDIAHMFSGSPLTVRQVAGILTEHFGANGAHRAQASKLVQHEIVNSFDVPEFLDVGYHNLRQGELAAAIRCIRVLKRKGDDPQIAVDFFNAIDQGRYDILGTHVEALFVYGRWRMKTVRTNGVRSTVPVPHQHEQMVRPIQVWNAYRMGKQLRSMPKYHPPVATGRHEIPEAI